eukprot:5378255-Amphidinium_carterae.1
MATAMGWPLMALMASILLPDKAVIATRHAFKSKDTNLDRDQVVSITCQLQSNLCVLACNFWLSCKAPEG